MQHDGARAHTGMNAMQLITEYIRQNNWNIKLITQPPQSPDLNVLDLGLFNGMKKKADSIKGNGRNINTCVQPQDV